jgi:hypothetical protein
MEGITCYSYLQPPNGIYSWALSGSLASSQSKEKRVRRKRHPIALFIYVPSLCPSNKNKPPLRGKNTSKGTSHHSGSYLRFLEL